MKFESICDSSIDPEVSPLSRSTPAPAQQGQPKDYAWSSGAQLVNYVSDKGDSLRGALYLPANYEAGKKDPTVVYNLREAFPGPPPLRGAERDPGVQSEHLHQPRLQDGIPRLKMEDHLKSRQKKPKTIS